MYRGPDGWMTADFAGYRKVGGKSGLHTNRVADNVRRGQLTKAGFRESATEMIPPWRKLR
jgi:hypothetical protein